jgi:hypothetical protein
MKLPTGTSSTILKEECCAKKNVALKLMFVMKYIKVGLQSTSVDPGGLCRILGWRG